MRGIFRIFYLQIFAAFSRIGLFFSLKKVDVMFCFQHKYSVYLFRKILESCLIFDSYQEKYLMVQKDNLIENDIKNKTTLKGSLVLFFIRLFVVQA